MDHKILRKNRVREGGGSLVYAFVVCERPLTHTNNRVILPNLN